MAQPVLFATRYNFIVLFLRACSLVLYLGILTAYFTIVLPKMIRTDAVSFKSIIGSIAIVFLLVFLSAHQIKLLIHQRRILHLITASCIVHQILIGPSTTYPYSDFKGYSISTYPTRFWDFKEIIIYLNNGSKWEFPQFLYWNFRQIAPSLDVVSVPFLGHEKFRWKWLDSRHYAFD